ncbi:MAG: hypothetical protein O3B13_02160 [Planctomycetota bacterium]|nr:hypothetical protein [Planctomycetota bacterium]
MTTHSDKALADPNEAFLKLVELFAMVPKDDRVKLMTMAITNGPTIDSDTQRWIIAVRNELAVFLSHDSLTASPSVIAHLEDTQTDKEIAFALDYMINELGNVTPSEFSGDAP